MSYWLYHSRRLFLSYSYEYFVVAFSKLLFVPRPFRLSLYFSLACILSGLCFSFFPAYFSQFLGFEQLNAIALTDVRAYYGTMLIAFGISLIIISQNHDGAKAALLIIAGFCLGSAFGRIIGMLTTVDIFSIHGLLASVEITVAWMAIKQRSYQEKPAAQMPSVPKTPEDFMPLTQNNFTKPYEYYQMLRDDYPVYKMPKQDYYIVSRYEDICTLAKNTEALSNKLVEILVTGRPKNPNKSGPSIIERMGNTGVIPVDVMALQDPPIHTAERKIGHTGFNAKFVKSLEPEVVALCHEMMDEFLPADAEQGEVEFIQDFAWRLPMRLIIRLLGFDENDFEQIKDWCVDGIKSLSGTINTAELICIGASAAQFMRHIWRGYLQVKNNPDNYPDTCFTKTLARLADDPDSIMNDQRAVATILQLLIAGSDSSASSMGSAIKVLAQNPNIENELRDNPELINLFVEEVFRTEAAFQGHFRLTKEPITLHGQTLPAASRIFLLWGSGNRDERFWDEPNNFNMHRKYVKKHLTFGHGIHACIGRELARMEIRIVITELLNRTSKIEIVGDTPYEASIFARTLTALPLKLTSKQSL